MSSGRKRAALAIGRAVPATLPQELFFAKPFLKPLATPFQRAMDRGR